ncbi:MAG TPA: DUF664 domain-containing protein [Nocardioides sp.]|jgi:hypothetical protein|uniref:mycothiol transferase n=1 Tax=Nocardioides sp. TaxID=35761 RepID=UPI002E371B0E|nr:DUF664 domain-containing protein [Nocardioides sp.]HEX3931669.1 DUF664 domain-containing protein [Nocardioides sp.]
MTDVEDTTPWEPPLAGTDASQILGSLDRMRWTFRWKAAGLDAAGLDTRIGASSLTLGGLLKHLATAEDYLTTVKLHGSPMPEPWAANGWDADEDWEFSSASQDSPEALYATYDAAVARARAAIETAVTEHGMDMEVAAHNDAGEHATLRRLLCDMVEEYGRHTGHADLLREAVDGRVGEDPPPGWCP